MYHCFQHLADREYQWRTLPKTLSVSAGVKHTLYFYSQGKHYIFFRELTNGDIGIISILHKAMDIPVRLNEDLKKIDTTPY